MPVKTTKKTTKKTVNRGSVKKQPAKVMHTDDVMHEMSHGCPCGCHCGCHKSRFIGISIKLIILAIVFFLGCILGPWIMGHHGKPMMRHMKFDDNGCVVMDSIKCPKMLETLATADADANGCITRAEVKAVMPEKHMMHKHHHGRPMDPAPEM